MKTSTRHPRTVRATAIAVALGTSGAEAARALGLPTRSVQAWVARHRAGELGDPELFGDIEALSAEFRRAAKVEMSRAVALAAGLLSRELRRYLERPADAPPLKLSELQAVGVVCGIGWDKLRDLGEYRPAGDPGRYVVEDPLADVPD